MSTTAQEGKDLTALKAQLKGKVQEILSKVADDGLEQSGLHIWSFGDLPRSYEQKRGSYQVKAWPALVDEKESVAIRLFDSEQEQQKMMWRGQRRLLLINVPSLVSTCMKNCRTRPSSGSTLPRMAKCWS